MDLMRFWNFIAEFDQAYDFHRKKVMNKYELSAIEVDVLLFVANNPEINTSVDIVRLRKIAKSHVSMAVKSLSEKGYIVKFNDSSNRKIIRLRPTPEATEIIVYGREEQKKFTMAVEKGLTEADRILFYQHMSRVSKNLQEVYGLNSSK